MQLFFFTLDLRWKKKNSRGNTQNWQHCVWLLDKIGVALWGWEISQLIVWNIKTISSAETRGAFMLFNNVPSRIRRVLSHRLGTAIAPFWFSMEHCWIVITSFWLSSDDLFMSMKWGRYLGWVRCRWPPFLTRLLRWGHCRRRRRSHRGGLGGLLGSGCWWR